MRIRIAGKTSTLLYWSGLLEDNPIFFPIEQKQKKVIQKSIEKLEIELPKVPVGNDYNQFSQAKRLKLLNDHTRLSKKLTVNAAKLKNQLAKKLNELDPILLQVAKELGVSYDPKEFSIFLLSKIGENAESLGDVLVIGDGFSSTIAIGIITEEILHSLIQKSPVRLSTRVGRNTPKRLARRSLCWIFTT